MIISASRRTDIPAFYAKWFMNRIRAGYCLVPNPFNSNQVAHISLTPQDVDAIVFWTRNPRPLFDSLDELNASGYRYYFQYTLLNYPAAIEPHTPECTMALQTFQELADRIGPERVIWRYDPVMVTNLTPPDWHLETYARLAEALHGCTHRSVISLLDLSANIQKRLKELQMQGVELTNIDPQAPWFPSLLSGLAQAAQKNGMEIVSCAEEINLKPYGIRAGKCIDDDYLKAVFGLDVDHTKDRSQRKACGCVVSKDVGAYDSCLFGCTYCYATTNFKRSQKRHADHDPNLEWLIPHQPKET